MDSSTFIKIMALLLFLLFLTVLGYLHFSNIMSIFESKCEAFAEANDAFEYRIHGWNGERCTITICELVEGRFACREVETILEAIG